MQPGSKQQLDLKGEIIRLMSENESLKGKLIEIQRESEDRENDLISEINTLVASINKQNGEEENEDRTQAESQALERQ